MKFNKAYRYSYQFLSDEWKILYDELLKGIQNFETEIYVEPNIFDIRIKTVLRAIIKDYPELFYFDLNFQYYKEPNYTLIRIKYLYDERTVSKMLKSIRKKTEYIVDKCKSLNEIDKLIAIHDYIINASNYDINAPDYIHTILGVLYYNTAVCDGISKSFKYICDLVGIESGVIGGVVYFDNDIKNPQSHAWNIVKVNGKYSSLDVTFDNGQSKFSGIIRYDYFLINDRHMLENRKIFEFETECTYEYDYYKNHNLYFDGSDDLLELLNYRHSVKNYNTIAIKVSKVFKNKADIIEALYKIVAKSKFHVDENPIMYKIRCRIWYDTDMRIALLKIS